MEKPRKNNPTSVNCGLIKNGAQYQMNKIFFFPKWSIAPASASSDAHSLFY
jgi:hypothetical protein